MHEDSKERTRISAFIICMNEDRQIRRCLESVRWCDEIVVVDSGSSDRTVAICKEYTNLVHFNPWPGYVEQKRFALKHCTSEWVINLDADEEISPQLRDEIIQQVLTPKEVPYDGYQINRIVFYLKRWWRKGGWYPEYRLRLCRRSKTSWGGRDPHEKAIVDGPVQRLRGELLHYTYVDIRDHVGRLNSYSSTAAKSMNDDGKRASIFKIFANPMGRFLKFYFLKKGYREGFPGFLVACLEGYYVFLKYIKLWELNRGDEARN